MPNPEHEKLSAIADKSQAIGEFLQWLEDRGISLAAYANKGDTFLSPYLYGREQLLAEHFEIDLAKLEKEKRAMLAELSGNGILPIATGEAAP